MKLKQLFRYLTTEPWWEQKVEHLDGGDESDAVYAWHFGLIDDYTGCILPGSYRRPAHIIAHVIVAFLSVFGVKDGRIVATGELYSPAATFSKWHKKLGGHGTGAY